MGWGGEGEHVIWKWSLKQAMLYLPSLAVCEAGGEVSYLLEPEPWVLILSGR